MSISNIQSSHHRNNFVEDSDSKYIDPVNKIAERRQVNPMRRWCSRQPLLSIALLLLLTLSPISIIGTSPPIPCISIHEIFDEATIDFNANSILTSSDSTLGFVENIGQLKDTNVKFFLMTSKIIYGFEAGKIQVLLYGTDSSSHPLESISEGMVQEEMTWKNDVSGEENAHTLLLSFIGSESVTPNGLTLIGGSVNYLIGGDSSQWVTDVPHYRTLMYNDLYRGIDLSYSVRNGVLKYEFIVHPGANPDAIQVAVQGHDELLMSENSTLCIRSGNRTLMDTGLRAFYLDDDNHAVSCSIHLTNDDTYGFDIGEYDSTRTLIIDPLLYSSYFGGSSDDTVFDLDVDARGSTIIIGETASIDLWTTPGTIQNESAGGGTDAFICKLGPGGKTIQFMTYLGGRGSDSGRSIKVDERGFVYVTGFTYSADFPMTLNGYDKSKDNDADVFVCKLDSNCTGLIYSTFIGSLGEDIGHALDIDDNGNAYIIGYTKSIYYPVTFNAFQRTYHGEPRFGCEGFITKLASDGNSLSYSTFLGGTKDDVPESIEIDPDRCAHVVGMTLSEDFPVTGNAFQHDSGKVEDAFLATLNAEGTSLVYSTYLGGYGPDRGTDVAVDDFNNTIIVGTTGTKDFPVTDGALQYKSIGGINSWNGFIAKVDSSTGNLTFSTYFGNATGSALVRCKGVEVSNDGRIFVTGYSNAVGFPTSECALRKKIDGTEDAFLSVLTSDGGSIIYSTLLGGNGYDEGVDVEIDGNGIPIVVGNTQSSDFPVTSDANMSYSIGGQDVFVTRFPADIEPPYPSTGEVVVVDQHQAVLFDGSNSTDNVGISHWNWSFVYRGTEVHLTGVRPTFTFDDAGTYIVTLNVTDPTGNWATDKMAVTVRDITPPIANAGPDQTVNQSEVVTLDGTGSSDNLGIAAWQWSFLYDSRQVMIEGMVATQVFDVAGDYLVTLRVLDAAGNWDDDSLVVTVRDITSPEVGALPDQVVDEGTQVTFDGSLASDNVEIVNYTWTFMDEASVTLYDVRPSYRFENPGSFLVTLKVTDAMGNWDMDTMTVTVNDTTLPVADAGPDQRVPAGSSVLLDGSHSTDNGGIRNHSWGFTYDGQVRTLEGASVQFTFAKGGVFSVVLTVADAAGNHNNDTVVITVVDTGRVSGIVLDGDGKAVKDATVVVTVSNGESYTATTATNGSFAVTVFHGDFKWRISKDGYKTISGDSSVAPMDTTELDLADQPLVKKGEEWPASTSLLTYVALGAILVMVLTALVMVPRRKRGRKRAA